MTGIDKICDRIQAQTDAACDQILSRAQEEARGIRANCEEIAQEEAEAIRARGAVAAKERELRLGGVAELEARKLHLKTKQEMIEQAFSQAEAELQNSGGAKRIALLGGLAARASVSGHEEIILSQKDRDEIGMAVVKSANAAVTDGELTLASETRDMNGGLILREGSMEINCTFDAILRGLRDTLSGDVAEILFQ